MMDVRSKVERDLEEAAQSWAQRIEKPTLEKNGILPELKWPQNLTPPKAGDKETWHWLFIPIPFWLLLAGFYKQELILTQDGCEFFFIILAIIQLMTIFSVFISAFEVAFESEKRPRTRWICKKLTYFTITALSVAGLALLFFPKG